MKKYYKVTFLTKTENPTVQHLNKYIIQADSEKFTTQSLEQKILQSLKETWKDNLVENSLSLEQVTVTTFN